MNELDEFFGDEMFQDLLDPEKRLKKLKLSKRKGDELDALIHATFTNTEPGKKLLGVWTKAVLRGTIQGTDMFTIGRETMKQDFIRAIIAACDRVDNQ